MSRDGSFQTFFEWDCGCRALQIEDDTFSVESCVSHA
jgi:hypothetical protein